jgi:nicotinate-nucleotide--dimethylbenzimidazole phosphoribosyltransferase
LTLAALGGFEIAALSGLMLGAASRRLPVAVDGVISSAAALAAVRLCPAVLPYLFFSHQSSEPGHAVLLHSLGARPLLDLDLHLGEGSGAALGIAVIESAMRLYAEMATFESASVSGRS